MNTIENRKHINGSENPEKAGKEKKTTAKQRKPTKMKVSSKGKPTKEKTMIQANDKKHSDIKKVKSCMTDYSRREQRNKRRSRTIEPPSTALRHTKEKYAEV